MASVSPSPPSDGSGPSVHRPPGVIYVRGPQPTLLYYIFSVANQARAVSFPTAIPLASGNCHADLYTPANKIWGTLCRILLQVFSTQAITWDKTLCPDGAACAINCALDGADYSGVYGVTSGDALTHKFITNGANTNVGSRLCLLNSESSTSSSSTFDVEVSDLPCGLTVALYFSEMDADGRFAKHSINKASAKPTLSNFHFQANSVAGNGSSAGSNSGTNNYSACGNEMDIWLPALPVPALSPASSAALTPPAVPSTATPPSAIPTVGDKTFYRPGLKVNTSKKFTAVTQFISSSGTATVDLTEIRRLYVQNGIVIQNSKTVIPGLDSYDSITGAYCDAQKTAFGDTKQFQAKGGLTAMGKAAKNGMVLVLPVRDDHAVDMLWLDSTYPTDASASTPGVGRGTCATSSGTPTDVETDARNSSVTYSNIRFGEIGSTCTGLTTGSTTSTPGGSTSTALPSGATQVKYSQCGGIGYTGPTICAARSTCTYNNKYYSQCL
ncbi:hypothetical protein DXG01_011789 [Tephrocybe rancida]|nr:hypothetical protein DXG01_011789 [Tephrocybe rancida]